MVTTTYDSLARPTAISRSGYPTQYLGYRTPDSVAPGHAVMFIRTVQAGVPESREYKDVLGRTLRTATRHFNGTNFIKQDVVYNTKWAKNVDGKSFPVEYRHKSGAEVNIDTGHLKNGPEVPHVGWQTGGKRGGGGAVRGHILLDDVPYNR